MDEEYEEVLEEGRDTQERNTRLAQDGGEKNGREPIMGLPLSSLNI